MTPEGLKIVCSSCFGRNEAGISPKSPLKNCTSYGWGSAKGRDIREWEAADEFQQSGVEKLFT